jgi:hypothetical protein
MLSPSYNQIKLLTLILKALCKNLSVEQSRYAAVKSFLLDVIQTSFS